MLILRLASVESFLKANATARKPMARWVKLTAEAEWQSIVDVRKTFPTADAIRGTTITCFNIGGNSFRLLTVISYRRQQVTIQELMTHAQYTKKYG